MTSRTLLFSTESPFGASFIARPDSSPILFGGLALVGWPSHGMADPPGRSAGVIASVMVVITLYRVEGQDFGLGNVRDGAWILAAGGIIA